MEDLNLIFKKYSHEFALVIDLDYRKEKYITLDLTKNNNELMKIDVSNSKEFSNYINNLIEKNNAKFAIGKYLENRMIYDHSEVFSNKRTVHLGIDLWVNDGIKVFSPFKAKVHSFANNNAKGDYGATIILEHEIEGIKFYTLYGHLSLDSLDLISKKKYIEKGELIGFIGSNEENGDWPPHLHFQIIKDMQNKKGDFYGACDKKEIKEYSLNCLDPNLILQIK